MTTLQSRELLQLAHTLSDFAICGEGNVSTRYENGFLIKSSGTSLDNLSPADLTYCTFDGEQINPKHKKPSIETSFHAWFMRTFDDINFIAHTHPTNTTKILCSNLIHDFASRRLFPDQIVRNGTRSCVVPYASPGIEILNVIEKSVSKFLDDYHYFPKLILLQNHGIITASKFQKDCITSTFMCEKSAEIFIGAHLLGQVKYLSEEQIDAVNQCPNEIYRRNLY
jgi:L-fuculose-phosphate aldolase